MMSNSSIGINIQSLYQFTNKYHRILCLRHMCFLLSCLLSSLQLETVWASMPSLFTKMTNPQRSIMLLIFREVRILRLRLFKIYPNLPRSRNFFFWLYKFYLRWFRRRKKVFGMSFKLRDAMNKT